MGAAALPIGLGVSAGVGAIGSVLSAKAAQPKATPIPPPAPLFPGMQQSYLDSLNQSGVGAASLGSLSEIARTGIPTDVGPAFEKFKSSQQRFVDEGRANLIEKYGAQGLRFSSTLADKGVDYESQVSKDFASILADYTMKAQ